MEKERQMGKTIKRLLALAIAMVMVLGMTTMTALAADSSHSITIKNTNTSISIDGKTYNAYKLFDSTHSGTAYAYYLSTNSQFYSADLVAATAPTEDSLAKVLRTYFDFTVLSGDTSKVSVTPKGTFDATAARAFADAIQPYLKNLHPDKTGTASGETCTINLDVDEAGQGYYIVTGDAAPKDPNNTETVESAVIVTNEDPSPVINPKASIPTLDKKITGVTDDGEVLDAKGKAAVAKIGSTVSYELDSIVPDLTGYKDYTFTFGDKITAGLDYVANSFKLKVGSGTAATVTPTIAADGKSFTYTIPYNTLKTYTKGDAIVLTYDCTVNSSALTTDYENNTADLEYSNNPYDNTTNKTPEKETYVIDLNLDVEKIDGTDSRKKLDGAEFKLYREVTTTTPADPEPQETSSTSKEYYKWDNNKVTWTTEANADVFTTNAQGKLTQQVRGLDAGNYFLVETKAPTGYNLLKDPVAVVITATPDKTDGVTKVTYSATYGGENATMTNGQVDLTSQTQASGKQPVATGVIQNNSGTELPSTGGMGTTIFYVVGALLVLAAAIILISRRRAQR
jgi:fimbrial isopeptide formation D2 family protein/LPXTG-motif cell wall-anchored protein